MKKLIIGLGNPGLKYKYTRHNVGFILLDALAHELGFKKWKEDDKFNAKYILKKFEDGSELALLKPQTFMNNSGAAVAKFMKYYDIKPEDTVVINDELDLPFLEIKKQMGAGSAGHNGVADIIEKLGTKEFWRVRVGIGRPVHKNMDPSDWVLAAFTKKDLDALNAKTTEILDLVIAV